MVIARFVSPHRRWYRHGQMWSREYTGRICFIASHYWAKPESDEIAATSEPGEDCLMTGTGVDKPCGYLKFG